VIYYIWVRTFKEIAIFIPCFLVMSALFFAFLKLTEAFFNNKYGLLILVPLYFMMSIMVASFIAAPATSVAAQFESSVKTLLWTLIFSIGVYLLCLMGAAALGYLPDANVNGNFDSGNAIAGGVASLALLPLAVFVGFCLARITVNHLWHRNAII
jgi:hypothetical protein